MSFNPFKEKPLPISEAFGNWETLYPSPYNKHEVDPYTKCRIILMNGTEFEANWFSHQFDRNCPDNDLRRELALTRAVEQRQQKKIACLKPKNESILEHTISYEQLAVDLTATLAQREKDCNVKRALDFALLEDFDHLYRYANLLNAETDQKAERLVGGYTEITPARPTISHHRFPADNIRRWTNFKTADIVTKLNTLIITAAEQQTMNYYMNVVNLYQTDIGRKLYQEIALVEEEHVSQYESLMDPNSTWLENLLMHEYNECYLYYSCLKDESDCCVRGIWEEFLNEELSHLHKAAELLYKYEDKGYESVVGDGAFPEPLRISSNISYVREILKDTVQFTSVCEDYLNVNELTPDSRFFAYNNTVNGPDCIEPSHIVTSGNIRRRGRDYRFETKENPIPQLRNRRMDNTEVGRRALPIINPGFDCND